MELLSSLLILELFILNFTFLQREGVIIHYCNLFTIINSLYKTKYFKKEIQVIHQIKFLKNPLPDNFKLITEF